jgi:DNA repair exonuclease SbcCD nuclease subunit
MKNSVIGVLVNDVHLNKDNGSLVKSIFNQLIKICKDNDTNTIFCGGDVFTNRSGQPLSCLTDWDEILNKLNKNNVKLYAIPGNHDKTDSQSNKSYLCIFSNPCFTLYSEASVVNLDKVCLVFIPYFDDESWLNEYNKIKGDIDFNKTTILITHSGFDGVKNNDGSSVESIIKPSMFENFTKVLIGHYHNASKISNNIYYTGSAYQNNFGETFDDKGCTLIYQDGTIKFVPLKFPRYIKEIVNIDDKETLRNLLDKYGDKSEDNVRFVFRGKKVDADKVDLSLLSSLGISATFEAIETEDAMKISEDDASVMCYDKSMIKKDFVKFCSENSIKGKQLKYGMKLINSL